MQPYAHRQQDTEACAPAAVCCRVPDLGHGGRRQLLVDLDALGLDAASSMQPSGHRHQQVVAADSQRAAVGAASCWPIWMPSAWTLPAKCRRLPAGRWSLPAASGPR